MSWRIMLAGQASALLAAWTIAAAVALVMGIPRRCPPTFASMPRLQWVPHRMFQKSATVRGLAHVFFSVP